MFFFSDETLFMFKCIRFMEREFMQMPFPCYLLYSLLSLLGQFQELSDPIQIVKVQNLKIMFGLGILNGGQS